MQSYMIVAITFLPIIAW